MVVDGLWLRGAVWKKGTKSRRWLEAPFEPTETGHGSWLKVAFGGGWARLRSMMRSRAHLISRGPRVTLTTVVMQEKDLSTHVRHHVGAASTQRVYGCPILATEGRSDLGVGDDLQLQVSLPCAPSGPRDEKYWLRSGLVLLLEAAEDGHDQPPQKLDHESDSASDE